ncbi:MAG: cell division protein FtsZ, partial [Beijerinckiaceae bacterium]
TQPAPVPLQAPVIQPAPVAAHAYGLSQPEPVVRQVRMPQVSDMPVPGQRQYAAAQAGQAQPPAHSAEAKRMTLLQRLAAVGLGRTEEAAHTAPPPPPQTAAPSAVHADYARRPVQPQRAASGQLDAMGRPAAAQATPHRSSEEDQLEIPAFLRRQAH